MENTPPPSSGGKSVLAIVVVIVLLLVVGFVIAKKVVTGVQAPTQTQETGDENTITTDQGSVTYGNSSLPKDWPTDVPQYPGASVAFAGSTTDANGKAAMGVVFYTSDTPEKVMAYYQQELPAKGWTVKGTSSANGSMSLSLEKDSRAAVVLIAAADGGKTGITISVGEK